MNKLHFLLATACLVISAASCSDDNLVSGQKPISGVEVVFGAGSGEFTMDAKQTKSPLLRTVYGVEDNQTVATYDHLTVHWLTNDKVRIYSPQAASSYQWADYAVTPKTQDATSSDKEWGTLSKVGSSGVRWGDNAATQTTDFYAFYPADDQGSRISLSGLTDNTTVKATLPIAQEHGEVLYYDSESNAQVSESECDWKIVKPDMDYAMMVAHTQFDPSTQSLTDGVSLEFYPIVTVLDVVVNGPSDNTTYDVATVSVQSSSQSIVGEYSYDIATDTYTYPDMSSTTNMATVDCMYNQECVSLTKGQKLNVKFFLLPRDITAKDLTIYVMLKNGTVLTKKLSTESDGATPTDIDFAKGKIIKIQTPMLKAAQESNWMQMIDDDVYFLSQLTLPGTKQSFTYNYYNSDASIDRTTTMMQAYQKLSIDEQFDAGIRAFDVKVDFNGNSNYIYVAGRDLDESFSDFLTELNTKLQAITDDANKPTEAAVIFVNWVSRFYTAQQWVDALDDVVNTWNSSNNNVVTQLTPSLTMGDMRGKIAIIVGGPSDATYSGSTLTYISDFSSSQQLLANQTYSMTGGCTLQMQQLYQLNNPEITSSSTYAYSTLNGTVSQPIGLLPYFITDPLYNGSVTSPNASTYDLIAKKISLAESLFSSSQESTSTTLTNVYINDLGGACVVQNAQSTGWNQYGLYSYRTSGRDRGWSSNSSTGYAYSYQDLLSNYGSSYVVRDEVGNLPTSGVSDNQQGVVLSGNGCARSEGGNTALLAQYVNHSIGDYVYKMVESGRAPLGIIYMNFAGTEQVTLGNKTYNVYGETIPALLISHNFKFPLSKKTTSN